MTVITKLSLESCLYHGYHSNVYGDENLILFRVLSDCHQPNQYPADISLSGPSLGFEETREQRNECGRQAVQPVAFDPESARGEKVAI